MAHERLQSKTFLGITLTLAGIALVENAISVAYGHPVRLFACSVNLAVVLLLLTRHKHAFIVVRIWAALPVLSLGLFLLASLLRWRLGETWLMHLTTALGGALMFVWAGKAFRPAEEPNNSFKPNPLRGSA